MSALRRNPNIFFNNNKSIKKKVIEHVPLKENDENVFEAATINMLSDAFGGGNLYSKLNDIDDLLTPTFNDFRSEKYNHIPNKHNFKYLKGRVKGRVKHGN